MSRPQLVSLYRATYLHACLSRLEMRKWNSSRCNSNAITSLATDPSWVVLVGEWRC